MKKHIKLIFSRGGMFILAITVAIMIILSNQVPDGFEWFRIVVVVLLMVFYIISLNTYHRITSKE